MRKEKWVALRPPSWGGGNRDDSGFRRTSSADSRPISLVHVFALERLGFREGAFCVLHFLELVRDEFHAGVHEVANRCAHGLRAARKVVDLHEEVERLQVPRGEAQRHLFRIRISHVLRPASWVKTTSFARRASGGTVTPYLTVAGTLSNEGTSFRVEGLSSIVVQFSSLLRFGAPERIVYRMLGRSSGAMTDPPADVFLLPGPVKMDPRVLQAMARPAMNHRDPEFKEILADVRTLTQYLFGTKGEVGVLSGSGTAGLEAAGTGLVRKDDRVLDLGNGQFSQRFHELCGGLGHASARSIAWGPPGGSAE